MAVALGVVSGFLLCVVVMLWRALVRTYDLWMDAEDELAAWRRGPEVDLLVGKEEAPMRVWVN